MAQRWEYVQFPVVRFLPRREGPRKSALRKQGQPRFFKSVLLKGSGHRARQGGLPHSSPRGFGIPALNL